MVKNLILNISEVLNFLYTKEASFTIEELLSEAEIEYTEENIEFLANFIIFNALAYNLDFDDISILSIEQKLKSKWISGNYFFNGKTFAIKPTKKELSLGIFVPGSRMAPYLTPILLVKSCTPAICHYNDEALDCIFVKMPLGEIKQYYNLISHRYLHAKIARLKENEGKDVNVFTENSEYFYITAYDFSSIYKELNIQYGDLMLFSVNDWRFFSVDVLPKKIKQDTRSIEIYEQAFSKYMPMAVANAVPDNAHLSSTLSNMLYFGEDDFFAKDVYVPLEDFLKKNKHLSHIHTIVGDNMWIADMNMPLPSLHANYIYEFFYTMSISNEEDANFALIKSDINKDIIDAYFYRFFSESLEKAKNNIQETKEECIKSFLPSFFSEEQLKKYRNIILPIVQEEYDICLEEYEELYDENLMNTVFQVLAVFEIILRLAKKIKNVDKYNESSIRLCLDLMTKTSKDVHVMLKQTREALREPTSKLAEVILEDLPNATSSIIKFFTGLEELPIWS